MTSPVHATVSDKNETFISWFCKHSSPIIWKRVLTHIPNEHIVLRSQIGYLILRTCVLATDLFPRIPRLTGEGATVILSTIGMSSLNIFYNELAKKGHDCHLAWIHRDHLGFLLSVIKTAIQAIDMGLCCAGFVGSLAILFKWKFLSIPLYRAMSVIGVSSLVVGMAMDIISDYIQNTQVRDRVDSIPQNKKKALIQNLKDLIQRTGSANSSAERKIALQWVRQLPFYEISTSRKKLNEYNGRNRNDDISGKFLEAHVIPIHNNINWIKINLHLSLFWYACRGIASAYPNSLPKSITYWITTLLQMGSQAMQAYEAEESEKRKEDI